MSRDPYVDVKNVEDASPVERRATGSSYLSTAPAADLGPNDVETNISNLASLLDSYRRIQATSNDSPSLRETEGELQSTLQLLEADLADLDESVRVVEGHGDRWGIAHTEVAERRAFLNRISSEVARLKGAVANVSPPRGNAPYAPYRDEEEGLNDDHEEAERWEREEQQTLMRRQDDTLGFISGTLHSLASQAGLIGQEVHEHSEMLDDLSTRVDTTQSRLSRVTRTMGDFIRRNEDSRSSWCIAILILILIILLICVILL